MPEALYFDMYGTLCDTQAITTELRRRVDAPTDVVDEIARLWRDRQLNYMFRVEVMDDYRPVTELTAEALAYALDYHGRELSEDGVDAVLSAYDELDPFDDALEALEALDGRDLDLAVFSNGNPEMLEPVADNAGITKYVDEVISAHEVETHKPDPRAYEHAAGRFDRDRSECWLVSSNKWDTVGATTAGMGAAWVDRSNEPYDPIAQEPTAVVESLTDLADAVDAA